MGKKVLVSGYYGFSNPGDDAILEEILKLIKSRDREPVVLYNTNRYFFKEGVHYVPRNSFKSIIYWMRLSSLLISGGGGLFQDATSFKSFLYYFLIILLAKIFGKSIIIYGQSFGPINRAVSLKLLTIALFSTSAIFLRDTYSLRLTYSLGRYENVFLMPDVVYLRDMVPERTKRKDLKFLLFPRKKGDIEILVKNLDDILKSFNISLKIIPMHYAEDISVAKKIYEYLKSREKSVILLDKQCQIGCIMREISGGFAVLSYRFHALLFAHILDRSFLGISDDPKIISFLSDIKTPYINLNTRNLRYLKEWIFEVISTRKIDISLWKGKKIKRRILQRINQDFYKFL